MADPVAAVVAAPKKAFAFAENNIIAFLVLALVLMVVFVAVESRKPGQIVGRIAKIPGVGPWATNTRKAA
jgi:hypothetical protein